MTITDTTVLTLAKLRLQVGVTLLGHKQSIAWDSHSDCDRATSLAIATEILTGSMDPDAMTPDWAHGVYLANGPDRAVPFDDLPRRDRSDELGMLKAMAQWAKIEFPREARFADIDMALAHYKLAPARADEAFTAASHDAGIAFARSDYDGDGQCKICFSDEGFCNCND